MSAGLERRYRLLLRCYPPSHREAHREEMLGVLLAAARPGQRSPGAWQAVNLAACGLAIRTRRALVAGPWQDALAVVSLVTPVLMLVSSAVNVGTTVRETVMLDHSSPPGLPFWSLSLVPMLVGPVFLVSCWLTVVVLGLAGRRRAAAAVAFVPLALALLVLLVLLMQRTGAWSVGIYGFLYGAGLAPVLASLAACSLAFSAGPRRGLAIAGRRQARVMIAVLSAGSAVPALFDLVSRYVLLAGPAYSLLSALAIAVALAVTRARGLTSGRVTALLAIGFLVDLDPFTGTMTSDVVLLLGTLLLTLLVWPVAIASWKGRPVS
ncbi:MAG: hypothetical protein ABSB59_39080 [Streptosporangiaceae bacterium]